MAFLTEMSVLMVFITLFCHFFITEESSLKIQFYTGYDSTDDGIAFKLWNDEIFITEPDNGTIFDEDRDYSFIVETSITDLGPQSKLQAWLHDGSDGITLHKIIIHNLDTLQKWHYHPKCQLDDNEDDEEECIVATMFPIIIVTNVQITSSVKKIGTNKKIRKGKILHETDVTSLLHCTVLCLENEECSAFHIIQLDSELSHCELVAEGYRIFTDDFTYYNNSVVYQLHL